MTRALVAALALSALTHGQRPAKQPTGVTFRGDSRLVLVPVIVTDRRGAAVNGLTAKAFRIFENRLQRDILSFSEEEVPCSIGVVMDLSGSMRGKLDAARRTLRLLFDLAAPDDEAMLAGVSDRPDIRSGFTGDFGSLLSELSNSRTEGGTALVDTIYLALQQMKRSKNPRRTMFVVSDGMDNHSRYSQAELMKIALESNVDVHTLAIYDPPAGKKPIQLQEENRGLYFLRDLAARTGGLHYVVRKESDMRLATQNIGRAMRSQYIIGFHPLAELDGRLHDVQVQISVPDLRAHSRNYFLAE